MRPEELQKMLCFTFCGGISVNPVATGYAISTAFEDNSGDRISFYLTPSDEGFVIEDDGSYLAHLIAKDIPIEQGQRGQLLEAILSQANAFWDRETLEIRTSAFPTCDVPRRVIDFLSAMIRVRDLELFTREVVRSTFREDAIGAMTRTLDHVADLSEDEPISKDFKEFPADLVIRPHGDIASAKAGAVYLVNNNDKLNEALLLKMESKRLDRGDFEVIALVEDLDMRLISRKRFRRAQNRDLAMPIFREDEEAAMNFIRRRLGLPEKQVA
jgi:hypothetical protein